MAGFLQRQRNSLSSLMNNPKHNTERLKDRQAYRQTLINRIEELGAKLKRTEGQIKALRTKGGEA